jgi:hypothetical protein
MVAAVRTADFTSGTYDYKFNAHSKNLNEDFEMLMVGTISVSVT